VTKEEALQQAIRILSQDVRWMERSRETSHDADRNEHLTVQLARRHEVIKALQGAGGLDGATITLNGNQARMLMNYLDRAHIVDAPVLAASVDFDEDKAGALEDLLKSIVAACRLTYLRSIGAALAPAESGDPGAYDDDSRWKR
jgi:hypothetical protein